ncbi:hypothetical protein J6590_072399 [Homalodisca vitripennis]|nr:hypothetical protein J6590_072399 [Homalodisca vitripennis]
MVVASKSVQFLIMHATQITCLHHILVGPWLEQCSIWKKDMNVTMTLGFKENADKGVPCKRVRIEKLGALGNDSTKWRDPSAFSTLPGPHYLTLMNPCHQHTPLAPPATAHSRLPPPPSTVCVCPVVCSSPVPQTNLSLRVGRLRLELDIEII